MYGLPLFCLQLWMIEDQTSVWIRTSDYVLENERLKCLQEIWAFSFKTLVVRLDNHLKEQLTNILIELLHVIHFAFLLQPLKLTMFWHFYFFWYSWWGLPIANSVLHTLCLGNGWLEEIVGEKGTSVYSLQTRKTRFLEAKILD